MIDTNEPQSANATQGTDLQGLVNELHLELDSILAHGGGATHAELLTLTNKIHAALGLPMRFDFV